MAAVAYLRTVNRDDQVAVSFVCSKTKIAPINAISIPRLELLAAEIGAVLGRILSSCLGVDGESMLLWTDSNDVLGWIRNRSRMFQPFVAHRVSRIQENCENSRWLKVSSRDNPADLATRGLKASEFWNHSTWLEGPEFLKTEESTWPAQSDLSKFASVPGYYYFIGDFGFFCRRQNRKS